MGWNYLSIPKLQRCNCWSLGMDKLFHTTLYWACDYLSILGYKLNHVSKRGYWYLHDTKPSPESMLVYSVKFPSKCNDLHSQKCDSELLSTKWRPFSLSLNVLNCQAETTDKAIREGSWCLVGQVTWPSSHHKHSAGRNSHSTFRNIWCLAPQWLWL